MKASLVVGTMVLSLALIFVLLVQPRIKAAETTGVRIAQLRKHLASMEAMLDSTPDIDVEVDPLEIFELRVPADNQTPQLLEHVERQLLDSGGVRNLRLAVGDSDPAPDVFRQSPQSLGGGDGSDPRLALFPQPLSLTPITISFDSTYAGVGQFVWKLRWLPTLVEIRSLEMRPASDPSSVHLRLALAALRRSESDENGVAAPVSD